MKKLLTLAILVLVASGANAADTKEFVITIKDHKFEPVETKIPANEKVRLLIKNLDSTAEEFESHDLKREKIVKGNGEIKVVVGPLKPGRYNFFGEFNADTAQGFVVVE